MLRQKKHSKYDVDFENTDLIFSALVFETLGAINVEGKEVLQSDVEPEPLQAALIGAAQRVEHYEIAAYGTARAHAKQLGYMKAVDLLGQTLEEEKQTDELLTKLAENRVNVKAAMSS